MSGNWALVKDGVVVNVIVWDGESPIDFGDGVNAIEYDNATPAGIGYTFNDGKFTAPTPSSEEIEQQNEDAIKANAGTKEALLANAKSQIVVFQTKLLLGKTLTDDETSLVNSWLDYISSLDAINANTSEDVSWPSLPN